MTTASNITTAEQLLAESDRLDPCELIQGELHMMSPPGGDHGRIALRLGYLILRHTDPKSLGEVVVESGFLLERNPDTVRSPDVAFVHIGASRTHKYITVAPAFVAEVLSPNDAASEVTEKVRWWLTHGVALVWVVDPPTRTVTAHRPGGASHVYADADEAPLDPPIIGLTIRLPDLFA